MTLSVTFSSPIAANFRGKARFEQLSEVQRAAAQEYASEVHERRKHNQRYKHVWKASEDMAIVSAYVTWAAAHPNKEKPRSWFELNRTWPAHIPLTYIRSRWRKIRSSDTRRRKLASAIWAAARAALQKYYGNLEDSTRESAHSRQCIQEIVDELHDDEDVDLDEGSCIGGNLAHRPLKAKKMMPSRRRLRVRVIRSRLVDGFPRRNHSAHSNPLGGSRDRLSLMGVSGGASYELHDQWKAPLSLAAPLGLVAMHHSWADMGLINSTRTSKAAGSNAREAKMKSSTPQPLKYTLFIRALAWEWHRCDGQGSQQGISSLKSLSIPELDHVLQNFIARQNIRSLAELEPVSSGDQDLVQREIQLEAYVVAVECAMLTSLVIFPTASVDVTATRSRASRSNSWVAAQGKGIAGVALGLLRSRGILASAGKFTARVSTLLAKDTRILSMHWADNDKSCDKNDGLFLHQEDKATGHQIMATLLRNNTTHRPEDVVETSTMDSNTAIRKIVRNTAFFSSFPSLDTLISLFVSILPSIQVLESLSPRFDNFSLPSQAPRRTLSKRSLIRALACYSLVGAETQLPPYRIQTWSSLCSDVLESRTAFQPPDRLTSLDHPRIAAARLKMAQGAHVLVHGALSSVVLGLGDDVSPLVTIPVGDRSETWRSVTFAAPRVWIKRPSDADTGASADADSDAAVEFPESLVEDKLAMPLLNFVLLQVHSFTTATSSQVCRALNEICGSTFAFSMGEVEELLYALEDCGVLHYRPRDQDDSIPSIFRTSGSSSGARRGSSSGSESEGYWCYRL